ncbi:MAG: hypothetical protein V4615_02555 [Bacteroidota bacterium]
MAGYIHVGGMIEELLEAQHRTKRDLGLDLGMSQGNVSYLVRRESIDVQMLHKIGNNLKYNFWKHYPIEDGKGSEPIDVRVKQVSDEKDKVIEGLNGKISEQEKVIADLRQQLVKQENDFLREINGLLKKKG